MPPFSHRQRISFLPSPRAIIAGSALWLAACGPAQNGLPDPATQLIVIVRPGPATWFPGPDGNALGFEHDLLTRFAAERKLPLSVVVADSASAWVARLRGGDAHIAIGGLFPPPDDTGQPSSSPPLLWTHGYYSVEPVLVYNVDGYRPRRIADLSGAQVAYAAHSGMESALAALRSAHPEVTWRAIDAPSNEALIAQVSAGDIDYAVVPSNAAAVLRNIYLDFDVAFAVGPPRDLAWALPAGQERLRDALDEFFEQLRQSGTLARYAERYFAAPREVERIDAGVLQERIRSMLPQLRYAFQQAQAVSGIEWRLIAAIAYQESQWDPLATSETGVKGLMQLTEDTARRLGLEDRLDARLSVLAAARYLRDIKSKLPARIAEPDRTWLALAAFNIGIGHLEDARILAQKQKLNPDLWSDVRIALPLLADPDYYQQAKNGYARGGMPVAFVDRVRGYYDILLRAEPSYQPRLRAWSLAPPPDDKVSIERVSTAPR
ncbi:MAG TPA: membrane-bound lytic murein transglycosylase MltF [Casimicrobiaceae bacterium]|nr:membrane-bound lytic murein transglycosylase MltF [Casimicrobiaceae bacterium]